MYRLIPWIPILEGFFLLKVQKGCVYVIMLKIALVLVENVLFGLKKGISGWVRWIAPKLTAKLDENFVWILIKGQVCDFSWAC